MHANRARKRAAPTHRACCAVFACAPWRRSAHNASYRTTLCATPSPNTQQQPQTPPAAAAGAGPGPNDTFSYPPPSAYAPSSFGAGASTIGGSGGAALSEPAKAALARAARAMRRYGWLAFWSQLTMSVVSGVILLFSVAFTSPTGPRASLYLTLVGIACGFLSTFWAFGYQRTAQRMQEFLDGADVAKVRKQAVLETITRGVLINIVGMAATLVGISTLVGLLVAKTLANASVNPFLAAAAGGGAGYNPVLALDVFLVQAATNTLLGHFLSLICGLWLLHVIGEGRGLFRRGGGAGYGGSGGRGGKDGEDSGVMGRSMSNSVYRIGGGAGGGAASAFGWPPAQR